MGLTSITSDANQIAVLNNPEEDSVIESMPLEILEIIFSQSGFSCVSISQTCQAFRYQVLSTSLLKIHNLANKALSLSFETAEKLPWSRERSLLMAEAAHFVAPFDEVKTAKAMKKTVQAACTVKPVASKRKPHGTKSIVLTDLALSFLSLNSAFAKEVLQLAQTEAMQNNTPLKRASALSLIAGKAGVIDPLMQKKIADLALQEIAEESVPCDLLKPIMGALARHEPVKVLKTISSYKDATVRAVLLEHALNKVPTAALLDVLPLALAIARNLTDEEGDHFVLEGDAPPTRDDLLGQIVTLLVPLNLQAALAIAAEERDDRDYLIGIIARSIASGKFDDAFELAQSIENTAIKLKTLREIVLTLASENYLKALVVAGKLNNEQIGYDLTMSIIRYQANEDPDLALAQADNVKDPIQREAAFLSLLDQWTSAKRPEVFLHLHELKSWMNRSRQALKIIKAFPEIEESKLNEMLQVINTPFEKIESRMEAAKILEQINPLLSTSYALSAMSGILEIPPQSSNMITQLKTVIGDFARLQPDEALKLLSTAKAKKMHELIAAYLIISLAKSNPHEAFKQMRSLITSSELREEILVAVAKSIARSGKPKEVELMNDVFTMIENETVSTSKVKLYLSLAEALTKITPVTAN